MNPSEYHQFFASQQQQQQQQHLQQQQQQQHLQQQYGQQPFGYPGQHSQPQLYHHDVSSPFATTQQHPYMAAPFSQPMSTPATPASQQPGIRHSASPQQSSSPHVGTMPQQPQQQQPQEQNTPPVKYPMAAPPLPQTPLNAPQQQQASQGQTQPQGEQQSAREAQRIKLLFEINVELLQEINELQAQGKGGATSPQHQLQLRQAKMDDKLASDEYIQCLRRVQANLSYLAPKAEPNASQKAPAGPAFMTPPAHMSQLQARYDKLRELFPGWVGFDVRQQSQQQQQQQQRQQQQASPAYSMPFNMMNATNGMGSAPTQA